MSLMVNFLFFTILLLLFACTVVFFILWLKSFKRNNRKKQNKTTGLLIGFILSVSTLIIFLFVTSNSNILLWSIDSEVWDHFGSFIGAVLLAATLLYQIRAFRRQQVEAKFFEMVKYYRDNISEMRYRNPFYYKDGAREVEEEYLVGRRVIKTIFEQYKVARKICHQKDLTTICLRLDNEIKNIETKWIEKGFGKQVKEKGEPYKFEPVEWKKKYVLNEIAYQITFWGIPQDVDKELNSYIKGLYLEDELQANKKITEVVKNTVTVWEYSGDKKVFSAYLKNRDIMEVDNLIEKSDPGEKVKFFGGHQYHLGHFFRHLFQTVKFIDSQPSWLMSDTDKYDYIKTLRAQMSNYEQALLFINSLTKLGRNWEYDNKEKDLISDYNLIKNLPENFIPYMKPQYYYPDVDYEWKDEMVDSN